MVVIAAIVLSICAIAVIQAIVFARETKYHKDLYDE